MNATDLALMGFTLCNSARLVAYVPQIACLVRDADGARAISCTTWTLFALSHLSTIGYALTVVHDLRMAAIFGVNTLCCLGIVGLTLFKRRRARAENATCVPGLERAASSL